MKDAEQVMGDWALEYVRRVLAHLNTNPTDLAIKVGVSSSTLTRPLNPKSGHPYAISRRTLEKIRDYSGVPFPDSVSPNIEAGSIGADHMITISVFDVEASAGSGSTVGAENVIDEVAFAPRFIRSMTAATPASLCVIGVKGDSMEPTLLDGDQVLVDTSKGNLDYDGLFVLRYGDALHVKRVGRHRKRGWITITSDNDQYRQIDAQYSDVDIIGRVLWFGRKV